MKMIYTYLRITLYSLCAAVLLMTTVSDSARAFDVPFAASNGAIWSNPELECSAVVSSGGGCGEVSFTAATYNIFNSQNPSVKDQCRNDKNNNECTQRRVTAQAGYIKQQNIDIVGLQEMSATQYRLMKQALGSEYDAVPTSGNNVGNLGGGSIGVFWKKSVFTKVTSGTHKMMSNTPGNDRNGDGLVDAPWVSLEAKNGVKVYAISTHWPRQAFAKPSTEQGLLNNFKQGADLAKQWAKEVASDGVALMMGDFNDGRGVFPGRPLAAKQATYCNITNDGTFQNASDMADKKDPSKQCPSLTGGKLMGLDQIYVSPGDPGTITASDWRRGKPPAGVSDHDPVLTKFTITGTDCGDSPFPSNGGKGKSYKNPIINQNVPDPSVIQDSDGTYHLYATGSTNPHYTSKDLTTWKKVGSALKGGPGGNHWAPDVAKVGDMYVYTYSVLGSNRSIHYATSKSAGGPFQYQGQLVGPGYFQNSGGPNSDGTIDSHIFVDGNKAYLFYGGGTIGVVELIVSGNRITTKDDTYKRLLTKGNGPTIEGAFVVKRDSWYYLYYSYGNFESKSGPSEYSTRVARSRTVTGNYTPGDFSRTVLTGQGSDFRGPGHNSVIRDASGTDWIVYHAWHGSNRVAMIDPIDYSSGWPVVNDGHPSSASKPGPTVGQSSLDINSSKGSGGCNVCVDPNAATQVSANTAPSGNQVQKTFTLGSDKGLRATNLVKQLMLDFNFTDFQAAGIVGNFVVESGGIDLPPAANEASSHGPPRFIGGYGWAQWTGGRQVTFIDFAIANGFLPNKQTPATDAANYAYLVHELTETAESKVVGAIRQTKDANSASVVWQEVFERAGISHQDRRNAYARQILEAYRSNKPVDVNSTPTDNGAGATATAAANCGSTASTTGQSPQFGTVAFPLRGDKSVVLNPESAFVVCTTGGCHPYLAHDIYANAGTTVLAYASGTVTATHDGALGKGVSVFNEQAKLTVYYTHMQDVSVRTGQKISPGDALGTLASTDVYPGINTDHLHIDASTDRVRQGCDRSSCSILDHFREIGPSLEELYNKLPGSAAT